MYVRINHARRRFDIEVIRVTQMCSQNFALRVVIKRQLNKCLRERVCHHEKKILLCCLPNSDGGTQRLLHAWCAASVVNELVQEGGWFV